MSLWKQFRAILMPVFVAGIIPALIVSLNPTTQPGVGLPAPFNVVPLLVGIALIGAGVFLVVSTVRLFITVGEGTLAPWDPTQKLVVVGVYRYVRNPMITGVGSILLGEAVLLGSLPLLIWFALFALINAVYIPLSEEPGLIARFQDDYRLYQRNVPRWLPRLTPWTPPWDTNR